MKKLGRGLALIISAAMVMILALPMGAFAQEAAGSSSGAGSAVQYENAGSAASTQSTAGSTAVQDEAVGNVSATQSESTAGSAAQSSGTTAGGSTVQGDADAGKNSEDAGAVQSGATQEEEGTASAEGAASTDGTQPADDAEIAPLGEGTEITPAAPASGSFTINVSVFDRDTTDGNTPDPDQKFTVKITLLHSAGESKEGMVERKNWVQQLSVGENTIPVDDINDTQWMKIEAETSPQNHVMVNGGYGTLMKINGVGSSLYFALTYHYVVNPTPGSITVKVVVEDEDPTDGDVPDPGQLFPVSISLSVSNPDFNAAYYYTKNLTAGTHTIAIEDIGTFDKASVSFSGGVRSPENYRQDKTKSNSGAQQATNGSNIEWTLTYVYKAALVPGSFTIKIVVNDTDPGDAYTPDSTQEFGVRIVLFNLPAILPNNVIIEWDENLKAESHTITVNDIDATPHAAVYTRGSDPSGYLWKSTTLKSSEIQTPYSFAGSTTGCEWEIVYDYIAPSVYNVDDIKVINQIIDENGLTWTKAPEDGTAAAANFTEWTGVHWTEVAEGKRIERVDISNKSLSGVLDISGLDAVYEFYCNQNELTGLKTSGNTTLATLSCYQNNLTALDVSTCDLGSLSCENNQLTSLDVSKNTNLRELNCRSNKLTSLDVSKNVRLRSLYCADNKLALLDVSKNPDLFQLECAGNQLTSLDLSKNGSIYFVGANYQTVSLTMAGGGNSYSAPVLMGVGASFGGAGAGGVLSYAGGILTSVSKAAASATFTSPTGKAGKELSGTLTLTYHDTYWTDGAASYTQGGQTGLTHVSPHAFSLHNNEVYVDGKRLTQGTHYTAAEGSTRITLLPVFLSTLSPGTHTLRVGFSGNTSDVVTTFTVAASTINTPGTPTPTRSASLVNASPKTGDEAPLALYGVLMLGAVSAIALCAVLLRRKQAAKL